MIDLQNPAPAATLGLPARIAAYRASRWDLNALWQLREDVRTRLRVGAHADAAPLQGLDGLLSACLAAGTLPSDEQAAQLQAFGDAAAPAAVKAVAKAPALAEWQAPVPLSTSAESRFETPPIAYWRQWSEGAEAPVPVSTDSPKPPPAADAAAPARMAPMNDTSKPAAETSFRNQRIYHLTKHGTLAQEIHLQLEQAGVDLELLDSAEELSELLQALPADLLLIDAEFADDVLRLGGMIGDYRRQHPKYLTAVQLLPADSEADAGDERFAMMDAVISGNADARGVVARIDQILRFGKTERYRVMIVEDDRSQAMFAEGILRNAEISTKVLLEADNLIGHIESFKPDLILMDLNMPKASGIELTEIIRQSEQFQNIPIVFLSGESDEERQMDALEAGGDDFLSKPIRPRRLIAAVQNRIKRHRALRGDAGAAAKDTGLIRRTDMLNLLEQRIERDGQALFFIELNGINLLKDRLGLSALENLLREFSAFLAGIGQPAPVARFGDGAFALLYQGDTGEAAMTAQAAKLRERIMAQKFEIQGQGVEFRAHIGVCAFEHGKGSTDILINAAERTARAARSAPGGVVVYRPQSSAEVEREEAIIALLANADSNGCLSHLYQPIVAVAGGAEKQFQSLLRLTDGNGAIVPATEFIHIAEKSNLIIALDRWSMTKAVATISERAAAGDQIKLFVNQSNITLLDESQPVWLRNLLKAYGIPENSLVIEINHNDALLNQQSIKDLCQGLSADGVQFCLSRYNPRNDEPDLLGSLPISYVKLANRLTAELGNQDARDQVKALADNAHRRGVEVIGHCVEDAQSAAALWMSGIDFIQGNLVHSADSSLEFGFDQSVL
ncbi:EAL domain-containing protein [Arenimonas sp. GDDSR-1]|uniref:EAL domain-containing protein n=1 Tax=Arenimonas sp. GDDSR-1 TaxID=2950125 RepID=UPI002633A83A|nr:EAL domain-containing protein [Arenimonas sp. GDDSR-1]